VYSQGAMNLRIKRNQSKAKNDISVLREEIES
jgi:hypothetical protein